MKVEAAIKAREHGLISLELFRKLKPFFDFRNSLIHRYGPIDDTLMIRNIMEGRGDFERFVEEAENYLAGGDTKRGNG
ncbi:MAG: HepT-like ribonuclease domain-containing protein [Desulfosoma sp.]